MSTEYNYHGSEPMTLALTIGLLVFFFAGLFSIFFCKCLTDDSICSRYFRRNSAEAPPAKNRSPGLDASIIKSFPTFTYSSVKDLRNERFALECAICISEFLDNDVLRLFTVCCHVFHQECIDLWLENHKTCPVCRRALDAVEDSKAGKMAEIHEEEPLENSVSIDFPVEEERESRERRAAVEILEKFPRSNSTGHSIKISNRVEIDRYTLRLPQNLHANLLRGHHWTASCTTFAELQSRTTTGNGGFGEISDFPGRNANKVKD